MGRCFQAACGTCRHTFMVTEGGGFSFDALRCNRCGADTTVAHADVSDDYLAMLKGFGCEGTEPDGADWRTYPGEPITNDEYRRRVEVKAGVCPCGGQFSYDAPPRCPACRSDAVTDNKLESIRFD